MKVTFSVIIATGRGGSALERALGSISNQTVSDCIETLVIPDPSRTFKVSLPEFQINRRYELLGCEQHLSNDPSERIASMRNLGISKAKGEFVAFLDDDNAFLPHHLETLASTLVRTDSEATHSWRRILDSRRQPWLANCHPWQPDDPEALQQLSRLGLLHAGSNLLMDRARLDNGEQGMVDTSAWLFRGPTIRRFFFPQHRTIAERDARITEDDLLLTQLLAADISITCTLLPTVLYSLGGYSNT